MATMIIRTTVAFDPATAARLERLAKRWGVSKSEAMRRALATAEEQSIRPVGSGALLTDEQIAAMTPLEAFEWLQAHPQVPPGWGESFREELRAARERDAAIEDERERERGRGNLGSAPCGPSSLERVAEAEDTNPA